MTTNLPASQGKCGFCDEVTPIAEMAWVTQFGYADYACKTCIAWYDKHGQDGDPWLGLVSQPPASGASSNGSSNGTKYVAKSSCKHNLTPYQIREGVTVYLSGSSHLKDDPQGPLPDYAVYLASSWTTALVLSNDGQATKSPGAPAVTYVGWPDFGTVELSLILPVLKRTMVALQAGKKVEVGCMGGHGRTGTFVALLRVLHGDRWDTAIDLVRDEYCDQAIETRPQEVMVKALWELLHPEEVKSENPS